MMITAHSGCEKTEMNSWDYIRLASGLAIGCLELDIRKSADGTLLLTHDPIGEKPLIKLADAFAYLADKTILINCDLKEYGLEDGILSCAAACGIDAARIIFTGSVTDSMHFPETHKGVRVFINPEELVPDFYGNLPESPEAEAAAHDVVSACKKAGYDVINIDYRFLTPVTERIYREAGLGLSVWTVDDGETMRELLKGGLVNMTTNEPVLACRAVK